MTESGFPPPTQKPQARVQVPGQREGPEPNARLTNVPDELRVVEQRLQIKGRVIRENADGTIRVRTDKGDIDLKVSAQTPRPQRGDDVEIEIQPGRPPKAARVTQEQAPVEQRHAPPPKAQAPQAQDTQARQTATPVNIEVRPIETPPPPETPAPQQQTVTARAEPITPEQAAQFITRPLEIITSAITDSIEFQAQIISQESLDFIFRETLKVAPQPLETPIIILATTPQLPQTQAAQIQIPATEMPLPYTPVTQQAVALTEPKPQNLLQHLIPSALIPNTLGNKPAATILQTASLNHFTIESFLTAPTVQPITISVTKQDSTQTVSRETQAQSPLQTMPQMPDLPLHLQVVHVQTPQAQLNAPLTAETAKEIKTPQQITLPQIIAKAHTQPLILQNIKATEIPAAVIGKTPQSLPVLMTGAPLFAPAGTQSFFILHTPPSLALEPGAQVTIMAQPVTAQAAQAGINTAGAIPPPLSFLTPEPWPLLEEIFQTLSQSAPQAAQAFSSTTPSPANPAQLGPAAMLFIAAVRGGDLTQWLSDKGIEALKRGGRGNLITRLGGEGNALSRLSADPVSQDWRAISLPLFWEGDIQKIALHYKHDRPANENEDEGHRQTRFIFDLNLNHMGPVQIDGLFRKERLDVILRTEQHFSEPMQMEMRRLYTGALSQTQITGELSFQNAPGSWVTIKPSPHHELGLQV